jgi:hypothetical protein
VLHGSTSLGYVVATHQRLESHPRETVLTHYWPLDHAAPAQAREEALSKTHAEWCRQIVQDLSQAHPEIARQTQQIDVWLWGHGMVRPVPNFLWGGEREAMRQPHGRIHFAHTDMSGIALFEEAHARGLEAANALLGSPRLAANWQVNAAPTNDTRRRGRNRPAEPHFAYESHELNE